MEINKKIIVTGFVAIACTACQTKAQSNDGERQHRRPPSIEQLFKDLDANEDGKLSEKEVRGPLKKHFIKVDLNEDGYLTKEELEKAPKPKRKNGQNRD
ncbi:MAG: EF-hand domain-containing protein [Bacteroidota bacterium]